MSSRLDELIVCVRRIEPPTGAEDRMWTALQQRLAPPPEPQTGTGGPLRLVRAGPFKLLAGVALALGVGGLLLGGAGVEPTLLRSERLAASDEPRTPEIHLQVTAQLEAPAIVEVLAESPPTGSSRAFRKKRIDASTEPVATLLTAPARDDFAEVRLLEQIRAAKGEPRRQLQLIEVHEGRFRGGQLVQERMAFQVDALCGLGRVVEARQVAAELLRLGARAQYAARINASCAGS